MPLNPHTSIVRSYSERHKPLISAAQLGNCLGEARAHTRTGNSITRKPAAHLPCRLQFNMPYCQCHAPDVTNLPSVLQSLHSSFLKHSLRHSTAHCATQDSKNIIITNNKSPAFIQHFPLSTWNVISLIPAITARGWGWEWGEGALPWVRRWHLTQGQGEERSRPGKQVCKSLIKISAFWAGSRRNYTVSSSTNVTSRS